MYGRFTESARAVIKAANQETTRANRQYIGSDDILVGLMMGEANLATQILAAHTNVEAIRKKLTEIPKIESEAKTPHAKKVVEHAMNIALGLFHTYIGPEHLLLGLLQDTSSDASRALTELGIDLDQLKSEILGQLPPGSSEETQQRELIRERFKDHPDVKGHSTRNRKTAMRTRKSRRRK